MLRSFIAVSTVSLAMAGFVAPAAATTVIDASLYTLGNYVDNGGTRIGGAVAVAGNANINSSTIGANLGADRNNTAVVAVGGNIRYENSSLAHGNVVYGGVNTSNQYNQASTPGGSFAQGSSLNFAAINTGLLGLSSGYGAQASTGAFTSLWGAGTLTGGQVAGTDVFSLTTAQLGSVYSLRLIGTAGSKAVINVSGASFGSHFSFNTGNYAVSDIVFNFVDAREIGLGGINLGASILAPLAIVTQNGGNVFGSIAAGAYTGHGGNIGGNGRFEIAAGDLAGAVPEPATWAMLIAGFGMVGASMRRRRMVAA